MLLWPFGVGDISSAAIQSINILFTEVVSVLLNMRSNGENHSVRANDFVRRVVEYRITANCRHTVMPPKGRQFITYKFVVMSRFLEVESGRVLRVGFNSFLLPNGLPDFQPCFDYRVRSVSWTESPKSLLFFADLSNMERGATNTFEIEFQYPLPYAHIVYT